MKKFFRALALSLSLASILPAQAATDRKVEAGFVEYKKQTAPSAPASGYSRVWTDYTLGTPFFKDNASTYGYLLGSSAPTNYGVVIGSGSYLLGSTAAGAANTVLVGNGSAAPTFRQLLNADIDPAAAIAYSKLSLAGSVLNSDLANMPAKTFKGNNTGVAAAPQNLTATQLTAELNVMVGDSGAGGTKGLVPAPAIGDATKCLKGDSTFGPCGGGEAGKNYVKNPEAEVSATSNVTAANTTVTRNTTNPIGKDSAADFSFTLDSATDTVTWDLDPFDNELRTTGVCMASIMYKAPANGDQAQLQVLRSGSIIGQKTLFSSSDPAPAQVVFPCGSVTKQDSATNPVQVRLAGLSASSVAMNVGRVRTGAADYQLQTVGTSYRGEAYWAGAASCNWEKNSTAWGSFSANSSCTLPSGSNLRGLVSAPSTFKPAFKALGIQAGKLYKITSGGRFGSNNSDNQCEFRFAMGTDYSFGGFNSLNPQSGGTVVGFIRASTSGDQDVELQARQEIVSSGCTIRAATANGQGLSFAIEEIPESSAVASLRAQDGDYDWIRDDSFITPSASFGTVANLRVYRKKVGDQLFARGTFDTTTNATSSTATLTLNSVLLDVNKLVGTAQTIELGEATNIAAGTNPVYASSVGLKLFTDGSTTNQIFVASNVSGKIFVKNTGTEVLGNLNSFSFKFSAPIKGWTKAPTAVSLTGDPGYWNGYHTYQCNWSAAGGSYTTPTFGGAAGCALSERVNMNFGTVTTTGTNPWLNIVPKVKGAYKVCANTMFYNAGSGGATAARLVDDRGVVIGKLTNYGVTYAWQPLCGAVEFDPNVSRTIKIEMTSKLSGTSYMGNQVASSDSDLVGIEWEIYPVTQNLPGLLGGGNNNNSGSGTVYSARVTNNGSVATVISQGKNARLLATSGGATRVTTGQVDLTFVSGLFTSTGLPPSCTCTPDESSGHTCGVQNLTTAGLRTRLITDANTNSDTGFTIHCQPQEAN